MGRPLFSQAYTSAPAVRDEPEQPQPYEKWSYWNPFDPESDAFFADAVEERIVTPEPPAEPLRGNPSLVRVEDAETDSGSSSEASSSGRGTPALEEDGLSLEEHELEYRRRVTEFEMHERAVRALAFADDGQTYRAVARPHVSSVRTTHYAAGVSRSPSPAPMPIPRAQVAPEPVAVSPAVTRSNPIPIPAPARPTTPQHGTPTYSYGSPSPPPSVTPRLYTWASRTTLPTLPQAASPSSPLPNRSARRSFANIAASPSTARVIF